MTVRLEAVTFDVDDFAAVATFWGALLGREAIAEHGGALLPGDAAQVGLRFVTSHTEQVGRQRLHLHLTSSSLLDQQHTVDKVLRLGGRRIDVGQQPDDKHVVLVDPGGNELCVIEPDNKYLAGTGHLGEVTCDGTRRVGLFWRDALGWPLVWDQREQTAVQSPFGGTKISWDSWGSSPVVPKYGRNRQRFDLVAVDIHKETRRLVSLGATHVSGLPDRVELTDPDGNGFELRAG